MIIYTMKEWENNMSGSNFWEGMLSAGQVDFIIQECKTTLAYGDFMDPYQADDALTSETTQYLVNVTTLLNKMVHGREHINFLEGK